MSYDPYQQQQAWTPPGGPTGNPVPPGAELTTGADRWALVAFVISMIMVLSCIPGVSCLIPLAPLVTGIVALMQAKNAGNPSRARTYGWIATIIGALVLIAFVALVVLYGAVIMAAVNDAQRNLPRR